MLEAVQMGRNSGLRVSKLVLGTMNFGIPGRGHQGDWTLDIDAARPIFEAALERKVICVPGEFFDVNPGKRRSHIPSRLSGYVRLSFGPERAELERGLARLEDMVASAR